MKCNLFPSIYFTGTLNNYNCSTLPAILEVSLPFVTRTSHSPSTCSFSPVGFSFSVSFGGSTPCITFLNIDILLGAIPKPFSSHSIPSRQNLLYTRKTNKILSLAQIPPLRFRHIYSGLLDSSMNLWSFSTELELTIWRIYERKKLESMGPGKYFENDFR